MYTWEKLRLRSAVASPHLSEHTRRRCACCAVILRGSGVQQLA